MKQTSRFFWALSLLLVAQLAWSAYAPLHWNETGVRIRQGWHVEWQRSGEIDADGNVIYAWSDTREGDRDVYAQLISPTGNKLWDEDGALVISAEARQEDPAMIPTGFGDYIFIWNDFRDDTATGDMYAQKLDANGIRQWADDGVFITDGNFDSPAVFRIVADGTGGAIVIWNDLRNGDIGDIYATRIDANGNIPSPWPVNGMAVNVEPSGQRQLTVDTDGAGGAIIGWMDNQIRPSGNDLFIQRLTIDGDLAWNGGNPVAVCQADGNQLSGKLCPDGSGGVYMVWVDKRTDNNGDLYFQHIDNTGSMVFPEANGKVLYSDPGQNKQQVSPRIVSDGTGNAIILWEDTRNDPLNLLYDVYAQKVDSDGNLLWIAAGLPICEEMSNQTESRINSDGAGGAVAAWMDERNGNENPNDNIFAQKINSNGTVAWATDGIPVCEAPGFQFFPLVRATQNFSQVIWGDERSGSKGIWYQQFDNSGNAQLSTDGDTLVWGIGNNAEKVCIVPDDMGKFFIFFQDLRQGNVGFTAYVQIMDTLSNIYVEPDGIPICPNPEYQFDAGQIEIDACSDGDNGAIAVWQDYRDSNTSTPKIYGQRLSNTGELLWGDDGIEISPYTRQQTKPLITTDGEGGGIVAWSEVTPLYDNRVSAARVDQNGNTLWSIVVADTPPNPGPYDDIVECIIADGEGGAFICYQVQIPYNYNLYVRRVDGDGNLVWGDDFDVILCDENFIQKETVGINVGSEGAVFAWQDARVTGEESDIYAQRVQLDGNIAWDEDGKLINGVTGDQASPQIASDGAGHLFITWEDFSTGVNLDLYIQKIDMDGNLLYDTNGLPVCDADGEQKSPWIVSDGAGGDYIFWEDYRYGSASEIVGIHLTGDGNVSPETLPGWSDTWVENGNIVCDAFHNQLRPKAISDYVEGAFVVWEDKRSSGKDEVINLYAQRINGAVVGVEDDPVADLPVDFVLHQPYPNPFNPSVTITYDIERPSQIRLSVFDLQGRQVDILQEGHKNVGNYQVSWNAEGVSSGIYFIRLETPEKTIQQKAILLK